MPRSVKKGPFVDYKLMEKIDKMNRTNQKKIIKTCLIYFENNFQPTELLKKSFRKKLQVFAKFNNCTTISIGQSTANSYIQSLTI